VSAGYWGCLRVCCDRTNCDGISVAGLCAMAHAASCCFFGPVGTAVDPTASVSDSHWGLHTASPLPEKNISLQGSSLWVRMSSIPESLENPLQQPACKLLALRTGARPPQTLPCQDLLQTHPCTWTPSMHAPTPGLARCTPIGMNHKSRYQNCSGNS